MNKDVWYSADDIQMMLNTNNFDGADANEIYFIMKDFVNRPVEDRNEMLFLNAILQQLKFKYQNKLLMNPEEVDTEKSISWHDGYMIGCAETEEKYETNYLKKFMKLLHK